jgi:hypothetical protein
MRIVDKGFTEVATAWILAGSHLLLAAKQRRVETHPANGAFNVNVHNGWA